MCTESPEYREWARRKKAWKEDGVRPPLDSIGIKYGSLCSVIIGNSRKGWPWYADTAMSPSPRGDESCRSTDSDRISRWLPPDLDGYRIEGRGYDWEAWEAAREWPAGASVISYWDREDDEERWLEFRNAEGELLQVRKLKPGWCWCGVTEADLE